jgi:5-methyltetrahydropteroyltriglutamate--homocysteine methyltransferase
MGANRDLKKATEAYWAGKISQDDLLAEGKRLRQEHWKIQKDAGIDIIPSNDFAYYDQVLDHIQLFGVVPERYTKYNLSKLDEYFAMGRGLQKPATDSSPAVDVPALVSIKSQQPEYNLTETGNGEVV